MKKNPLISVIIPAYNCAEYIGKAIISVLAQEQDTEILVIDDGSTDHLKDVLAPFMQAGQILYLKNEKNMGVAVSRNRGVAAARGKYIAFLDGDDWWEEGKLALQLVRIREKKAVLCCTGRRLCEAHGQKSGKWIPAKEELTYYELLHHNSIACSSVLLRAEVAREFPMEKDECHEDYICWLKILQKYHRACGVNEPLLNYRLSEDGKSRNKWKSARMTYQVYKYMGLNPVQRAYYFISYMIHGVLKYS